MATAPRATLLERLSYRVDILMTAQPLSKLLALLLLTVFIIVLGAVLYGVFVDPSDALWVAWTYVADPGSHVGEQGLLGRGVSVVVTLGGLFSFALLVGLVADGIGSRVDELRKGRSRVLEVGHTLILGWSPKVVPLVRELAEANESEGGGVVVILSEREKDWMEEQVAAGVDDLQGTLVVCRTGSPMHVADLMKVAAHTARATVVVASGSGDTADDARAVRTVLALCGGLSSLAGVVVVELQDPATRELVGLVGGDRVATVVAHDMLGRLMIQCARQPGLAQVYAEMLGFAGDEFYIAPWPEVVGLPFREARRRFPSAVVAGIYTPEGLLLNPPDDRVVGEQDRIVALAEDNDTWFPGPALPSTPAAPAVDRADAPMAEEVLFLGWRNNLHHMIQELDAYVPAGSTLTILSRLEAADREALLRDLAPLERLQIEHVVGDPASRRDLEQLEIERYDAVVILAGLTAEAAGVVPFESDATDTDARSLVSLMLVRDIRRARGADAVTLISEVADPRTKRLISVTQVSDYVVSDELVSMALAAVAEDIDVESIWAELFDADGCEVYLRPASLYVQPAASVGFQAIAERARLRGEVALGYRSGSELVLNPKDKVAGRVWSEDDVVVVIAEEG